MDGLKVVYLPGYQGGEPSVATATKVHQGIALPTATFYYSCLSSLLTLLIQVCKAFASYCSCVALVTVGEGTGADLFCARHGAVEGTIMDTMRYAGFQGASVSDGQAKANS